MRILELTLLTPDLHAVRRFYGERLGLGRVAESTTSVTFRAGATRLTFEAAGRGARPFYHFAFNVAPERFDAAVEWIAARVPLLERAAGRTTHFAAWDAHAVYFEDPAGNVVELIARHALARRAAAAAERSLEMPRERAAPTPFGPGTLLSVSEIGLPVTHVGTTRRQLAHATGLASWGSAGKTFAALGDDEGLFILVDRDRAWYPTSRSAAVFPVVLTIEGRTDRRFGVPGFPYLVVTHRTA